MLKNHMNKTAKYLAYRKQLPWKRVRQIGYDKKLKLPIFTELTYDYFVNNLDMEWYFIYKGMSIDVATHGSKDKPIYELTLNGYDENKAVRYEFTSSRALLEAKIDGKTIKEIWEDLEN